MKRKLQIILVISVFLTVCCSKSKFDISVNDFQESATGLKYVSSDNSSTLRNFKFIGNQFEVLLYAKSMTSKIEKAQLTLSTQQGAYGMNDLIFGLVKVQKVINILGNVDEAQNKEINEWLLDKISNKSLGELSSLKNLNLQIVKAGKNEIVLIISKQ